MATEYELTFSDYLSIVRRRAPYLIGIFAVVLLISVVVAIAIPSAYRATGTIMVESLQIPDNIVPSSIRNQLDDQLNIIKQRVLTRENLVQLANKYSLFKKNLGPQTPSELLDVIRDRIVVETVSTNDAFHTSRQGQQAIAFKLSFEDRRPEVALQVTNDLITLFLDWNVKLRTESATETTAFLTQESNKLKSEVTRLEKLVAAYEQQNSNALPEHLTMRMAMLSRAENDLREVERDYRSTKEELRSLELEFSAARRGISDENALQTLPALKAELARLSSVYKESHPDIKRIKRRIEVMEKSADLPESKTFSSNTTLEILTPTMSRLQSRIDSDRARMSSLAKQREMLQSKIIDNENAMTKTPKVEQGLEVLIRDRDSAQKKYDELRNKQINAKIAENLESEIKSGRFSVLEPPLLPEKPFKPNRAKILLLGFFLALASAGSVMMVLESIDKRIRGIDALTHVLGYRPMVVIPFIPVKADGVRRKHILKLASISLIVAIITAIGALLLL